MVWSSSAMAGSSLSSIFRPMTGRGDKAHGQRDFDATTKHDMRSVSKSVISLLVGIAIDRKLIAGADEPSPEILSGLFGGEVAGLGQHHATSPPDHVVGHSVGRSPRLDGSQERRAVSRQRSRSCTLVRRNRSPAPPDTVWTYNGGGTDLLGNILERVRASRLKRSRAKRCSHHSALQTGSG